MAPSTIGSSYVLPVRLSVIVNLSAIRCLSPSEGHAVTAGMALFPGRLDRQRNRLFRCVGRETDRNFPTGGVESTNAARAVATIGVCHLQFKRAAARLPGQGNGPDGGVIDDLGLVLDSEIVWGDQFLRA